jgi:hypothetical protein
MIHQKCVQSNQQENKIGLLIWSLLFMGTVSFIAIVTSHFKCKLSISMQYDGEMQWDSALYLALLHFSFNFF